jgi:hypothetical protein
MIPKLPHLRFYRYRGDRCADPVERLVLWLTQSAVLASPALTSEERTECAKEIMQREAVYIKRKREPKQIMKSIHFA